MTITRISVADAQPGMRACVGPDSDAATITKVKRPKGADFLRITFVDDLGSVFSRKYMDGTDSSPTNWTIHVLT
jgi:hypothetical protein